MTGSETVKAAGNETVRPRLFVDMDGTLAEWRSIEIKFEKEEDTTLENILKRLDDVLYSKNYYRNLRPYENVVEAVRNVIKQQEIEVFILSCAKPDRNGVSPLKDKNKWLDKYLPEIDAAHRIFVPDGENKRHYVPGGLKATDALLDDYTKNLKLFEGLGIKLLNPVNSNNKTWDGSAVSFSEASDKIAAALHRIIQDKAHIRHAEPEKTTEKISDKEFLEHLDDDMEEEY